MKSLMVTTHHSATEARSKSFIERGKTREGYLPLRSSRTCRQSHSASESMAGRGDILRTDTMHKKPPILSAEIATRHHSVSRVLLMEQTQGMMCIRVTLVMACRCSPWILEVRL